METKKTTKEAYALKELVIKKGVPLVKEQLSVYIKKLKEGTINNLFILLYNISTEFSQGMVLPTRNSSNIPNTTLTNTKSQQNVTHAQQKQVLIQLHHINS